MLSSQTRCNYQSRQVAVRPDTESAAPIIQVLWRADENRHRASTAATPAACIVRPSNRWRYARTARIAAAELILRESSGNLVRFGNGTENPRVGGSIPPPANIPISVSSGYISDTASIGRRNTCFENIGWTTRDLRIHAFCGTAVGATRPSG